MFPLISLRLIIQPCKKVAELKSLKRNFENLGLPNAHISFSVLDAPTSYSSMDVWILAFL
jgi:hypothetical protein